LLKVVQSIILEEHLALPAVKPAAQELGFRGTGQPSRKGCHQSGDGEKGGLVGESAQQTKHSTQERKTPLSPPTPGPQGHPHSPIHAVRQILDLVW